MYFVVAFLCFFISLPITFFKLFNFERKFKSEKTIGNLIFSLITAFLLSTAISLWWFAFIPLIIIYAMCYGIFIVNEKGILLFAETFYELNDKIYYKIEKIKKVLKKE